MLVGRAITQEWWELDCIGNPCLFAADNTKEIQRNKIHAYLASLTLNTITDQIIVDCILIAKSRQLCASLGVINLAKEMFLARIAADERFQRAQLNLSKITWTPTQDSILKAFDQDKRVANLGLQNKSLTISLGSDIQPRLLCLL